MATIFEELHITYQKVIYSFVSNYPDRTNLSTAQIDNYCRACALYLWHVLRIDSALCRGGINAIYSEEANKVALSMPQIQAAMNKLSARNYSMPVPAFFFKIIDYDKAHSTEYSRRLASSFALLNLAFAMIDGEVEEKEANIISVLLKELNRSCDKAHIKPFVSDIDPFSFVASERDRLIVTAGETLDETQHDNSGILVAVQPDDNRIELSRPETKSSMDELDQMTGLSEAKKAIHEIADFAKVQNARRKKGLPISEVSYHLVFTGNPGTGKTTVARLVAKIYKDLGVVSNGHLVEVSAKELVAGYVGQTSIKTGEVIKSALGGVLFIDEAYSLVDKSGQGYGQEAIDTLLKEMEDHRTDFAVIVAGYEDLMKSFIESNPGLKSRFNRHIHFEDYGPEEMMEIFSALCSKNAYTLTDEAAAVIKKYFESYENSYDEGFANARTARNLFESIISKQASRIAGKKNITEEMLSTLQLEDVEWCIRTQDETITLDDAIQELNNLIGLETVKEEISDLIYIVQNQQRRKEKGLKVPPLSLHLVFLGNPGTGKTTVARCIAKIYKCLGLISKGQIIETDRSGLVAGYVGQTAIKTQEVAMSALGGILFVDEAYSLVNGNSNDYGQEAIDTLLKIMEDKRDDFAVIVAGYDDLMDKFIHSNPGLESRFNKYVHFEDYTADQMVEIFELLAKNSQYMVSEEAKLTIFNYFSSVTSASIGNGRGARNLFEKVIVEQAKRIERSSGVEEVDINSIIDADIQNAFLRGL